MTLYENMRDSGAFYGIVSFIAVMWLLGIIIYEWP